ncbi:unnamed protein product [Haemonchus placei]|uniref:Uncharacterized protein n=1 Tax=Haemonchus placei TaxID=6290 RepID=A0A0N4W6Y8_HAEPC|nr:unnamed protein product [Haemonchus placei]
MFQNVSLVCSEHPDCGAYAEKRWYFWRPMTTTIFIRRSSNRVTEPFRDYYPEAVGDFGTTTKDSFDAEANAPGLTAGTPRFLHGTEINSSTLWSFC